MKKYSLLLILLLLLSLFTKSQPLNPVKWEFESDKSENEIVLTFIANINKNWYMYAQDFPEGGPIPTSFHFEESNFFELVGKVEEITTPKEKLDEIFDIKVKLFSKQAVFKQKIKPLTDKPFEIRGFVEFMSCDDNQCLPPNEVDYSFSISGVGEKKETKDILSSEIKETTETFTFQSQVNIDSANDKGTENLPKEDRSLLSFFIIAFLAGLAGILTPCVYPMIPMTVSFFMRDTKNRIKAIIRGIIFGVSIIIIYTSIGLIVSLTSAGADFANNLSTHWIPNSIFFILFIIFAASFFGMFEIILPSGLANEVDKQADKGGYFGAFFMALALVIVSFSCTGPIVGALIFEAAGGIVLKPTIGMFGFGLAFALPFTFFAISPSLLKSLPKSGGWLNSVKVVMAFILLAFSLKFISSIDQAYHLNIISRDVFIALWIVIFLLMGVYLLGKIKFSHDSELKHIGFFRLLLIIASFTFAIYLIPGLFGAPLKPLSGLLPPVTSQEFDLNSAKERVMIDTEMINNSLCDEPKYADFLHLPHGLKGYFDYDQGMSCANKLNKPVFLDFKGHSCSKCKEMEEKVWSDPRVIERLNKYVIIALYADDRTKLPESEWITSKLDGKIKKTIGKKNADFQATKYNISAQPYYVLTDLEGNNLVNPTAYDLDVDNFIEFLDKGLEEFK